MTVSKFCSPACIDIDATMLDRLALCWLMFLTYSLCLTEQWVVNCMEFAVKRCISSYKFIAFHIWMAISKDHGCHTMYTSCAFYLPFSGAFRTFFP